MYATESFESYHVLCFYVRIAISVLDPYVFYHEGFTRWFCARAWTVMRRSGTC